MKNRCDPIAFLKIAKNIHFLFVVKSWTIIKVLKSKQVMK